MRLSRILFAIGFVSLGILTLIYGDASTVLQAMPHWLAGRAEWICACGAVMLLSGAGLFFSRTARLASTILIVYMLLWVLLLKLPILVKAPLVIVSWETFAITTGLLAAAWVFFASLAEPVQNRWLRFAVGDNGLRLARILFGLMLIIYGLAHFAYLKYTAALVPSWLLWPKAWVCLTGAGYMAAGMGIAFRICPRLAAVLVTVMMAAITFFTWIPQLVAKPTVQYNWTELAYSWTLIASAWVVAYTFRSEPWLSIWNMSRTKNDSDGLTPDKA